MREMGWAASSSGIEKINIGPKQRNSLFSGHALPKKFVTLFRCMSTTDKHISYLDIRIRESDDLRIIGNR